MAAKFIIYSLLFTATSVLANEEPLPSINRESKQLFGVPQYPYFPNNYGRQPLFPAAAGTPVGLVPLYSNKAVNRQSPMPGWEGPTYVGIFPVLTGQQACPACPEAPVCKNCTVCTACYTAAPQNETLSTCVDKAKISGSSASPNGTIKVTTTAGQLCSYAIISYAPYTKFNIQCTAVSDGGIPTMEPLPATVTSTTQLALNTPYTVTGNHLYMSFQTGSASGSAIACTWSAA